MLQSKAISQEIINEIGTQTLARFGLNIFSLNTYSAYQASVTATNNINASYKLNKNNNKYFGFTHEAIEVGKKNIESELYSTGEKSYTTDELAYINKEAHNCFDTQNNNDYLKSTLINQNYTKEDIEKIATSQSKYAKENHGLADVITVDKYGNTIKEEQHKVIEKTKGKKGLYGKDNKYIEDDNLKIVVASDDYERHKNELQKTVEHSKKTDDVEAAKKALEKLEKSQTSREEAKNPTKTAIKIQATQAGYHVVQAGMSDGVVVALSTLASGTIYEIKDALHNKDSQTTVMERIERLLKKVLKDFYKTFKRGAWFGFIDVGVGILSQMLKSISSKLNLLWKELRTSFKSIYNAIHSYISGEIKSYEELLSVIIKGILSAMLVVGTVAFETQLETFLAPIVTPTVASFLAPALAIVVGSLAVVVTMKGVDLALNTLFGVLAQRDVAKMKLEEIQSICGEFLPDLIMEQGELQELIDRTYQDKKLTFEKSFADFQYGLSKNNIDAMLNGLIGINGIYGKKLQFYSFSQFDNLMLSDESFKL